MLHRDFALEIRGLFDTMIAHYVIDADSRHRLDLISERYLGYSLRMALLARFEAAIDTEEIKAEEAEAPTDESTVEPEAADAAPVEDEAESAEDPEAAEAAEAEEEKKDD